MCHNLLDFFSQRNSVVYFDINNLDYYLKSLKKYLLKNDLISSKRWIEEELELRKYINKLTDFI